MASLLSRLLPWKSKHVAAEGEYRPGPYLLPEGWLSATAGRFINWWQMGYSPGPYGECSAMVEACISAYAQTVAMCPGGHWRKRPDGGRDLMDGSDLSRILRRPNEYQTISDLLLNLTRRLYEHGEAFALALRDENGMIAELHLMRKGYPLIAGDGSVFYSLGGNEIIDRRVEFHYPIPERDVLHLRLHTPRHELKGESPILATQIARAMSGAAINQQITYFLNQAKPSFILETDQVLTISQVKDLREAWKMQTEGDYAGGTPILTAGLKANKIGGSASDSQLAELLKMSDQNIALAFRMPLQVLGLGGTAFASTELLMQSWIASGLGFALNHIEEGFGKLFQLKGLPGEYLEFDTGALLRSAFRERVEAFSRGVIGGIFSSDEARAEFDYPATPGGHGKMPRVQQQVVPLSYGTDMKPPEPKPAALPAPAAKPEDSEDPKDDEAAEPDAKDVEEFYERYFDDLLAGEPRHTTH